MYWIVYRRRPTGSLLFLWFSFWVALPIASVIATKSRPFSISPRTKMPGLLRICLLDWSRSSFKCVLYLNGARVVCHPVLFMHEGSCFVFVWHQTKTKWFFTFWSRTYPLFTWKVKIFSFVQLASSCKSRIECGLISSFSTNLNEVVDFLDCSVVKTTFTF